MNPLSRRLAVLRLKVRFLDGWLGICALIALILGVGVTVGALDFWVHIPSLFRAILLVGLLVGSGAVAYVYLIRPFSRPVDDLNLALRIEEVYPDLNDSLASTVQFLQQSDGEQARVGGSPALRERTVQEALQKTSGCDFGRILDRRGAVLFGAAACCVLVVAGLAVSMNRAYAGTAFWRFIEPFGEHTWTQISVARLAPVQMLSHQGDDDKWKRLDPTGADRIAKGRPYFLKVNLQGQMPRKPEAKVEIVGQLKNDKLVPLKVAEDKLSASFETAIDMTEHPQKFKFRITANDGSFPPRANTWHEVEVLPPPKLDKLDGQDSPQIAIYPPAYTDLKSPQRLPAGSKAIKLYAGSNVVLRARADRPLEEAWIEYRPQDDKLIPASLLSMLGQANPLEAVCAAAGSSALWGRIPANFDEDKMTFSVTFMPWVSGDYVLYGRDADQLDFKMDGSLQVEIDPVPNLKLLAPRASMTVLPNANVTFKLVVTDEQFAIKSIYVEHRRKGASGDFDPPVKNPLYEASGFGRLLPVLMGAAARRPGLAELRLRPKKLDVDMVWALRNQFKVGDLVMIELCADDFCDIYPTRDPGRSHAVELRIISEAEMIRTAKNTLADVNQQLKKIVALETKSRDTVVATRKEQKIDPKIIENFIDNADTPQREVKDRTDNLRRDLTALRQMLRDNKLTDQSVYKDAKMIQGTLDSIAQQELPQIDAKIPEVRTDLSKSEKNDPKTQKKLDETAKLQTSVIRALNELIAKLNPEAKMQELANQLRDIKDREENLNSALQDAKDLNDARQKDDNLTKQQKADAAKEFEDAIKQKRTEQLDLVNKMENLLKDMKAARDEFEKQGDKRNAEKIDEALKNAEPMEQKQKDTEKPKIEPKKDKTPITAEMKRVAEEMRDKKDVQEQTLQKQRDLVQKMENMLKAMEKRSEQALNQDIKDRKDADQKVDELLKKLEKLRDENKKINMIEDKEERLKAKEKLAEKNAALAEEIENVRRELARLNEQAAAKDLKDAADKVEKAGNDLKNDGNPQPDLDKARQDLKDAKRELKEAQEELARELLVKIADQLEGLKIRQVATLERTENLHSKVMKLKSWTEGLIDTLNGNIDVQKGIADETDTFKDKLKDAKVFHAILKKAKEAMDNAVNTMKERAEEAPNRRAIDMGEKLDEEKIQGEIEWQAETVRHQKQAVKRLDHLLDAIKEEIAKMDADKDKKKEQAKNDDPNKQKDPDANDQPPPRPPGDGLPPMAQLKALRAEQLDLNERTADFAKRTADLDKLTDAQKKELAELTQEQADIHQLFSQMIADQARQMEQQEPKEKNEKKEGAPK